ncbi:YwqG family protein [Sphingopyxis sp.]|uniref:YwqG family protein n=1 Tax=Sphingopyxis sp. TaxID=1908224 RepID=UPI002ED7EF2B
MKNPLVRLAFGAAIMSLFGCAPATPAEPTMLELLRDPAVAEFAAWQKGHSLPAIDLEPAGPAPATVGGTRIGGPVWLAAGEAWPADGEGRPMSFLAQVDFAEMPPLPDYPESGVLQFFIARDNLYGANFEKPEAGKFRVIWREKMDGAGKLHRGTPRGDRGIDDYSPLNDSTVRQGVALKPKRVEQFPSTDSWLAERDLKKLFESDKINGIHDFADKQYELTPQRHHVGGHPGFTQSDWRATPAYQDVDRVLINLWSDDHLMWGDMGQGQFMIRREDLLKRDFSKIFYQWDCY